jgi:hypothetical protein
MTPAGVCALVKFLRHGKVQHRAVTFQLLVSIAVQHTMHVCQTDDEERVTTAAIGLDLADHHTLNISMMPPLSFNSINNINGIDAIDDAAAAFVIREVEDIAQTW